MNHILKTNIISFSFAIVCLVLFFFFPTGELKFETFITAIIFLLILPVLYTKIILHKTYKDLGFTSWTLILRDGFFLLSTVVVGGLLSFLVISLQWGVQSYLMSLSGVMLFNFGAFAIYEIFFASTALFLFTFFSWGFVYSIKCRNQTHSFIAATISFMTLLIYFYNSVWVILPMLVPVFFVPYIRDKKNIVYMFLAVFIIALILDTLIIKSFA